jgi:transcriptional regulator with XRE-family HTH domain
MINNGTVKVTTLEKIAKVLNVPVGVFFDDSFKIENWNPAEDVKNDFAKENEALKREIELLREINELLKKER